MKNILLILSLCGLALSSPNGFRIHIGSDSPCDPIDDLIEDWDVEHAFDDCCSSSEITCKDDKIIKIDFSGKNIFSKISNNDIEKLKKLDSLEELDLSSNYFYGKIPSKISELNIKSIDLSNNYFNGNCPSMEKNETSFCVENNFLTTGIEDLQITPKCNNTIQNDPKELVDGEIPEKMKKFAISALKCVLYALLGIFLFTVICILLCCFCCCKGSSKHKFRRHNISKEEAYENSKNATPVNTNQNIPVQPVPMPYYPSQQNPAGLYQPPYTTTTMPQSGIVTSTPIDPAYGIYPKMQDADITVTQIAGEVPYGAPRQMPSATTGYVPSVNVSASPSAN